MRVLCWWSLVPGLGGQSTTATIRRSDQAQHQQCRHNHQVGSDLTIITGERRGERRELVIMINKTARVTVVHWAVRKSLKPLAWSTSDEITLTGVKLVCEDQEL